jgi:hypothetical protein
MTNEQQKASEYATALDVFTSEGGSQPSSRAERPMLRGGAESKEANFGYKGYRYEQLADAVAYALLRQAPLVEEEDVARPPHRDSVVAPSDAEWALMTSLGIQFDGRAFRFAGTRYNTLKKAVNSARRVQATG